MMIFPTTTGSALDGRTITLPTGLEGEYNVLVIAFQDRQRLQVDEWIRHMRSLALEFPRVHVYELPTIQKLLTTQTHYTDTWTRRGLADPAASRSTIPIYVDINDFNRALDIPTVTTTYTMLVDREGEVLWRMQGDYDPLKSYSLSKTLRRVCRARQPQYAIR